MSASNNHRDGEQVEDEEMGDYNYKPQSDFPSLNSDSQSQPQQTTPSSQLQPNVPPQKHKRVLRKITILGVRARKRLAFLERSREAQIKSQRKEDRRLQRLEGIFEEHTRVNALILGQARELLGEIGVLRMMTETCGCRTDMNENGTVGRERQAVPPLRTDMIRNRLFIEIPAVPFLRMDTNGSRMIDGERPRIPSSGIDIHSWRNGIESENGQDSQPRETQGNGNEDETKRATPDIFWAR